MGVCVRFLFADGAARGDCSAYSNRTMSLNDGEPDVQGNLLSFSVREQKAATGKWESCFWISTFPRGRSRGWGNVGIALWRFPRAVGNVGKPAFGFPRFPLPAISTALFAVVFMPSACA